MEYGYRVAGARRTQSIPQRQKAGTRGQRQESILIQAYNGGYRCGVKRAARYDRVDMRGYADVCGIGRRGIQEGFVDEGKCPARFLMVGMARRS